MAEEGFIENIGELTDENFQEKMEEFKDRFENKEKQIEFDNDKKTVTIGETKFDVKDFLKEKEKFITEKLQDSKGVSEEEFKIQAKEDLKKLGIQEPVDIQIESLSESYKAEYVKRLSIQDMPTRLIEDYVKNIPEQQSEILIGEKIPVLDPQQRQEALENPERKEALDKVVKGITEKNPELK
jgi:hypothetical protein